MNLRPLACLVVGILGVLAASSACAATLDCMNKRLPDPGIDLLLHELGPIPSKSESKAFEKALDKLTSEERLVFADALLTYAMSVHVRRHVLRYNTWREADGNLVGIPVTLEEILAAHDCTQQKLERDYDKMSAQPLSDPLWRLLQRYVWRTYFLLRCVRDDAEPFPELHEQLDARIKTLEALAQKIENARPAATP